MPVKTIAGSGGLLQSVALVVRSSSDFSRSKMCRLTAFAYSTPARESAESPPRIPLRSFDVSPTSVNHMHRGASENECNNERSCEIT